MWPQGSAEVTRGDYSLTRFGLRRGCIIGRALDFTPLHVCSALSPGQRILEVAQQVVGPDAGNAGSWLVGLTVVSGFSGQGLRHVDCWPVSAQRWALL